MPMSLVKIGALLPLLLANGALLRVYGIVVGR